MQLDIAISVLIILVAGNYFLLRSVLYPPFIFCSMWLLDLSVYKLNLVEIDSIHANTLVIICVGAIVFSVGGVVSQGIPKQLINIRVILWPKRPKTKIPKYLCIALLLLCFPYLVHFILANAANGTGDTILQRARNASVAAAVSGHPEEDTIVNWFLPISTFLAILFQMEGRDRAFWFIVSVTFMANLISGGRTGLLTLIGALVCVHLLQNHEESFLSALKVGRLPVGAFLTLYAILIFVNRDTSSISGGVGGVVIYFVVNYIVAPTAAFDNVVQHPSDYAGAANHTFEFFLKGAAALHLTDYTPPPLFDKFLAVPFPTNVYTVYKFYFTDYGVWGCLLCITMLGFFHSLLYRKARTGSEISIFLFALSMYAVIMVIFDDLYTEVGYYLRAALFGLLYLNLRGLPLRMLSPMKEKSSDRNADGSLS